MLGTSETMRGSGPARACSRPAQSVRSEAVTRPGLRVPLLRSSRAGRAFPACLLPEPPIPSRWRTALRHTIATAWTLHRCCALGERGTWPIPGRRDAPPSSPFGFARAGVEMSSAPAGARRMMNKVTRLGVTLGKNTVHVFAMVRTGAGCTAARLPGSARRNADWRGPTEAPFALWAPVERACRTTMFRNLHSGTSPSWEGVLCASSRELQIVPGTPRRHRSAHHDERRPWLDAHAATDHDPSREQEEPRCRQPPRPCRPRCSERHDASSKRNPRSRPSCCSALAHEASTNETAMSTSPSSAPHPTARCETRAAHSPRRVKPSKSYRSTRPPFARTATPRTASSAP